MNDLVKVDLQPIGRTLEVSRGTPLRDLLFQFGVEFPCGGNGRCKGCRIRVLEGSLPVTGHQRELLSEKEISEGWRLACRCTLAGPVTLEIRQWETAILADDSAFEFAAREGLGIAVDLGTTTLVIQLVDLETGRVLGVRSGLNPQVAFGGDVMSRVHFAVMQGGLTRLRDAIRTGINDLIGDLLGSCPGRDRRVREVAIVGNTVMHHLFCGLDAAPLAHYPFEPAQIGLQAFRSAELGWEIRGDPVVCFLPCLGGFVGSDILAGILATRIHESESLAALIDLGTNGEVVLGKRGRLLCASTAAGPAFEGARITLGMRAATGAISEVRLEEGKLRCTVLGHDTPRGICGSGLVDAVAVGLELGTITASGQLSGAARQWMLAPPVFLSQNDIRELQLAKGAVAAAVRILLAQWGAGIEDVTKVFLAGAFGNYVSRASARRIGLIEFPEETVRPSGNTALLGAKLALFHPDGESRDFASLRRTVRHLSLSADPNFQDAFVRCMSFGPPP